MDSVPVGFTGLTRTIQLIDTSSDGSDGLSGVVAGDVTLDWILPRGASLNSGVLNTIPSASAAHVALGGLFELGNGIYRLDIPDAALANAATHVDVFLRGTGATAADMAVKGLFIPLDDMSFIDTGQVPGDNEELSRYIKWIFQRATYPIRTNQDTPSPGTHTTTQRNADNTADGASHTSSWDSNNNILTETPWT